MKKLIAGIMAVALVFGSAAVLPATTLNNSGIISASAGGNKEYICGDWKYGSVDNTASIFGYIGDYTETEVEGNATIPKILDGKVVTSISSNAFYKDNNLVDVTIPHTVKTIYGYAFYNCPNLKSVNIPASVTEIGEHAFGYYTDSDKWLQKIDGFKIYCYAGTAGEQYAIDNGFDYELKESQYPIIGDYAIWDNGEETASIQEYIGTETNVVIPDEIDDKTITGISDYAFMEYPIESVSIPSSITKICTHAFVCCTNLKEISIPDSVTYIGAWAFLDCKSLTDIVIPASVTEISYQALGYYLDEDSYLAQKCDFKIYCYSNTTGEKYAKDNGFDYELLDKPAVNGTGKVNVANSTSGLKVENLSLSIAKSGSDKTDKTVKIGTDGKFTVEGLADGMYDFTFSADKCVPRTYSVSVSNGTFKLDSVELHLYGDINGDGKITTADVGKANADARNSKKLTNSYDKKVADANGDGKITTADVGKVNAHVRNTKRLW